MDPGAGGPASHTARFLTRLVRKIPWASLVAQAVKNLPTMQKTGVRSPGWEDPLEKGTAASPVFWPEESHGLYNLWGCKESDATEHLSLSLSLLLR